MTGRGIDQVLHHPCHPALHESYVRSAMDYVRLAEEAHGPIPRPVLPSYIWGAALTELERARPDARIVNLETSITNSDDYADKGINYRMSPDNAECLSAAAIDCCVLANNHVLDWGRGGLDETLSTLERLRIEVSGAGRNRDGAEAPAILNIPGKGRVLVFSFASETSGTPRQWAATPQSPGVNVLHDLSAASVARIGRNIDKVRQPNDAIIASIHWGPNWGYDVPDAQRRFARALIDTANVSVVHGHSSHHAKAIEVYQNRLILYGCGDFLNDYEGIGGYEKYRGDLAVMYFADIDLISKELIALELVPLAIRHFRLAHPSKDDVDWVRQTIDRESQRFGAHIVSISGGRLALAWSRSVNHQRRARPGTPSAQS